MDISKTISEMTLEEKCSLLSGRDFWTTQPVERLGVPSAMVCDGPHGLRKQAENADHLGLNESVPAVCFPPACAGAASFDRKVLRQIGENIADACQYEKVAVNLGPAVNIKRSPLCGRNFEYFSEDPCLAGELATSLIKGVQSKNVGVSVKHFALNNQEHRRMSSDSVADERTIREIYFPAFENCVKNGKPWTVMCSYNRINGTFSSMNKWLLNDVLRDEWGFDGYVMTDWGAVTDRVEGVKAGLDLEMPGPSPANSAKIAEAVRSGQLDEALVDKAVERILTIHSRYWDNAQEAPVWNKEEQHELARKLAGECMVLLKNDSGVLPLKPTENVAFIGKFAQSPRFQGGGSSHINCFKTESLLDVLKTANESVRYTWSQGYDIQTEEPDEALIAEAVQAAAAADKAVIVAGLPDSFESEGYDRTHLRLPKCQNELISRVVAANPRTIVVLYNGSPVEMPWKEEVPGIVEGYLGGQAVGGATYDILYGRVNPSGRLPETFPLRLEDTPCYLTYGGEGDHAVYSEGIFVGYRYYDKKDMPVLFPFGYGLSYTTFAYSNLCVSSESIKDTDTLEVSVDVTNTGNVAGSEAVQLYVANPVSSVFRPLRELRDFDKVYLEPGETKTVHFTLCKRAFAYWNTDIHDWYAESGIYTIQIGYNSREIALEKNVQVESTTQIPRHYTIYSIFADLQKDPKAMAVLKPLLDGMSAMFAPPASKEEDEGEKGEPADSAISGDMASAMLMYMPLRSLVSFSGGQVSAEMLQGMLDQINN